MLEQLEATDVLYQSETVYGIEETFGEAFVYENEHGNSAIGRTVLVEFRRLTEWAIVWDRSERAWRWRDQYDGAGRVAE